MTETRLKNPPDGPYADADTLDPSGSVGDVLTKLPSPGPGQPSPFGWRPTSKVGVVGVLRYAINTGASQDSTAQIPAGALVLRARVTITTQYTIGTTIQVGNVVTADLLVPAVANIPNLVGIYEVPQETTWALTSVVRTTIAGGPIAGNGFVVVEYVES